jgi:2-(1,2-epoxy-1,2-dihydrophenyl)acetyl-CoA isomerase
MSELLEEIEDGIAWLTLNRPERMNAISPELSSALLSTLERLATAPEIAAVVLTGAGRAFCAGGDVKGMSAGIQRGFETRLDMLNRVHRIPRLLHEMPKPTIALVNGVAVGAGLSLALACDFRIMARTARFSTGFAKIALSGDYGGSWFMTRLVGTERARELYYFSRMIAGDEAAQIGLATLAVDDAELVAEGRRFVDRLRGGPTLAIGYMKKNLNAAEAAPLDAVLALEALHQARVALSEDHQEGVAAFVEKRAPVFRGR